MKQEHTTAAGAPTASTIKAPSIAFVLQDFLETASVAQVRNFSICLNFIILPILWTYKKVKQWKSTYIGKPNLRNLKCTCKAITDSWSARTIPEKYLEVYTQLLLTKKQLYKLHWQAFMLLSSQLFCSCTTCYWLIFFFRTEILMLPFICDCISDNNECLIGTHNCHDVAECTNTNGSFYCNCTAGFTGNGTFCQGIRNVAPFCEIKLIAHLIYL